MTPRNNKQFTLNNAKILKGNAKGYRTLILHFAPADLAYRYAQQERIKVPAAAAGIATQSDRTVCPHATAECRALCLNTAGNGSFPSVQIGRAKKTLRFLADPAGYVDSLKAELAWHLAKAERDGVILVVRLNGTQDLPWESIPGTDGITIMAAFPGVQFYDYTKIPGRLHDVPSNYNLTYSFTGKASSLRRALEYLHAGHNVAFVYSGTMPSSWHGFPVVDGDLDDLRFADPRGHAVALRAKGKASGKAADYAFVTHYA